MSSGKECPDFPDVNAKLQKPTKQSAFERQRAEAEAKRKREAAETAAVYAEFVKSFDREEDEKGTASSSGAFRGSSSTRGRLGFTGAAATGPPPGHGASKRHFVSSTLKSGPGSLGPAPTNFAKKRSFNDYKGSGDRLSVPTFEEPVAAPKPISVAQAFDASDDEDTGEGRDRAEERAIAKPTLRLANMPPGTSPAVVKALIPEHLNVENVKILPPAGPGGSERKCTVAIVTLSQGTPANDMDTAVTTLQNRYLGYGYYLSLHRHLSSAVAASAAQTSLSSSSTAGAHPFAAKPVERPAGRDRQQHHQQHGAHRGFAPPTSYAAVGAGGVARENLLHVPVRPPQDVKTIQLINKTIEGVLEHGAEFEALLMSRPEVQREEKWAWIWDARSQGGIWYRWRLWQVVTGADLLNPRKGKYVPLFDGSHAWKAPEKGLVFEYTTSLDEFVSDEEYNSSDNEEMDDEGHNADHNGPEAEKVFLNPLDKAKLVHLLARLPTTMAKLRKGDIARVASFAITHASRGADEVVKMIVANVEKPLCLTSANPRRTAQGTKPHQASTSTEEGAANDGSEASSASLVALYVVSDILSSSSTSGVRHAWRFRQLFETCLRERKVFERLGSMAEKLGWGRLRAEKWKRSIHLVLNLWEGWCVFPAESQELFVKTFEYPPSLKAAADDNMGDESSKRDKWKTLEHLPVARSEANAAAGGTAEAAEPTAMTNDVDGEPLAEDDVMGEAIDEDDVMGEAIDEDDIMGEAVNEEDVEGEPIDEDDVAGEPIDNNDLGGEPMDHDGATGISNDNGDGSAAPVQQRKRMRAMDMFADLDGSD
ncbi:hypothetical protein E4U15_004905 [Claviceps sp. LM218 group G6]|nr:hypothetical protein E4U15_004905 [Claviceps sp. LM218 group G6]